ncbi:MAG: hypothetical protein M3Q40_06105 [Pseudomonadota bacterium]|nr:hypothetical protein [Pseudomonadota bacterium]
MNKNFVIDLFGVLRIVGWACLLPALLIFAVAMLMLTLGGMGMAPLTGLPGALSMALGALGVSLVMVASLSRWLVIRMKFQSELTRPDGA